MRDSLADEMSGQAHVSEEATKVLNNYISNYQARQKLQRQQC